MNHQQANIIIPTTLSSSTQKHSYKNVMENLNTVKPSSTGYRTSASEITSVSPKYMHSLISQTMILLFATCLIV